MNLLQLIASNSYITLNKSLIKLFKMEGAAIIGMFASIANYNNNDWFYVTYERVEEELGLSKHQASKAIEEIIAAGILIDKREGIPCRRYFKFQEVELFNSLSLKNLTTSSKEYSPQASDVFNSQVVKKVNDINKNKNKNKEKESLSFEEVENFVNEILRERNFRIDIKKFHDWCKDEGKLKTSWKNILKKWIEKPENQIAKILEKNVESDLKKRIKKALSGVANESTYLMYFQDAEEKGNKIFVKSRDALRYEEYLKKINVEIICN